MIALDRLGVTDVKSFREFDINTHISIKNRYVYFQVSKAASSSIKFILQKIEVQNTGRKISDVNDRNLSPHIWPSQLDDELLQEIFFGNKYKKIAFVRNPYSRILSCYLHRIVLDKKSASNKALSKYTSGRISSDVSFDEFVRVICSQKSSEQESHWRNQSDDIFFKKIKYSFIGKVENLYFDLNSMLNTIGVKNNFKTKDKSPEKTSAHLKLKEYYNDELSSLVIKRFKDDFVNFNYPEKI